MDRPSVALVPRLIRPSGYPDFINHIPSHLPLVQFNPKSRHRAEAGVEGVSVSPKNPNITKFDGEISNAGQSDQHEDTATVS